MKKLVEDISFKEEDGQLAELFSSKAEEMAKLLNNRERKEREERYKPDISTTQYRKFYEKILELNEKAKGLDEVAFKIKVLPFVKMLNSKVQYSKERKHSGSHFVVLMETSIKAVSSAHELQNFKYLLESIIGYMPKK